MTADLVVSLCADDPTDDQFLTRDPLESGTREPYAYASNNPLNLVDPTGMAPWD